MPSRTISTPAFLSLLVAGVLLPMLVFVSIVFLQFATRERERYADDAVELARRVTGAVDRDLEGLVRALQVLATSRALSAADYADFHKQATEVKRVIDGDIIYKDLNGQQIVNTRLPFGTSLPRSLPEADQRALQLGQPYISGLFTGAQAQRLVISLYVRVEREGEVRGLLILGIFPERFAALLEAQGIPEGWTGSLVDDSGKIIARSRQHERFVGSLATPDLLKNATGNEGTWTGHTLEGTPVRAAYARSKLSGWRVAVGVPQPILEAPLVRSFAWLFAIGGTALLIGLGIAIVYGRQLARAMSGLATNARLIGRSASLDVPPSILREVQAIGSEMARASVSLHELSQTLEQQVRARTLELEATNARLMEEMSERSRAEEQLRQVQKMEAVGQLTGGLAHDFNNMLAVIGGSLELAQKRLDRGDWGAVARYLGPAQEGVRRAAQLTTRMLAFSRQQPLSPAPCDLNRLIADLAQLLQRTLGDDIVIEPVLTGELWPAYVDANQLENALLNIAVNARDAMPNGGKLTIETANVYLDEAYAVANPGVAPGQYVLVSVTDTGAGMSPEVAAKAFDPFFTTKPAGQGTGMGLSQVYGFVRQSGGHVKLYSEVGLGTTVKVYLPRSEDRPETSIIAARPANAAEQIVVNARVLVVEDSPEVREFSSAALREIGCRVIEASNPAEAHEVLDSGAAIDLLFTDIVMPGENGRVLAERAVQKRPGLKVLFTTGYSRNAISRNGVLEAGVQVLPKPFTVADLARKVREVLR